MSLNLNKRSLMVTYDVSSYLKEGENDLLIWLGQGWYKKTTFGAAYDGPLVKAGLNMLRNGKWEVLTATDTSWRGRESGYRIQVIGVLYNLVVKGWMGE